MSFLGQVWRPFAHDREETKRARTKMAKVSRCDPKPNVAHWLVSFLSSLESRPVAALAAAGCIDPKFCCPLVVDVVPFLRYDLLHTKSYSVSSSPKGLRIRIWRELLKQQNFFNCCCCYGLAIA